eukprot:6485811-Amphidinium_carterae.1
MTRIQESTTSLATSLPPSPEIHFASNNHASRGNRHSRLHCLSGNTSACFATVFLSNSVQAVLLREDYVAGITTLASHPRSFFVGLRFAANQVQPGQENLNLLIHTAFQEASRLSVHARSGFDALLSIIRNNKVADIEANARLRDVGLLTSPMPGCDRLAPFFVRFLGHMYADVSKLQTLYAADALVSTSSRVMVEKVVHSYEAIVRESIGQNVVNLNELFRGTARIFRPPEIRATYKFMLTGQIKVEVEFVDNLQSGDIITKLRRGTLVVSKKTNEPAME